MTTPIVPPIKEVRYDAETRDFCAYVNGEILGWAKTRFLAEQLADEYVYQLLSRDNVTAADLTPEEAEAVLEAQQMVAREDADQAARDEAIVEMIPAVAELLNLQAEERAALAAEHAEQLDWHHLDIEREKATAAKAGAAAVQAELEALERDAGVDEARRATPYTPRRWAHMYRVGDADLAIDGDGSLEMTLSKGGVLHMSADDLFALYVFVAELPGVATTLDHLEARRQQQRADDWYAGELAENIRHQAVMDDRARSREIQMIKLKAQIATALLPQDTTA